MSEKMWQNKILYGGDYNPEQWHTNIWEQDKKLLKDAGVDTVTVNTFNWAMLQRDETTYDFTSLDQTVKKATDAGLYICMATATAAHPPWMVRRYPDVLRTEFNGMPRQYGGRHNSCPNSPNYRKYSRQMAYELARRYKDCQNIILWHINNEYGGACYCDNCRQAFHQWLKKKYGSLEQLNREWNTNFWSHTFYDWAEIPVPNILSEYADEKRSMHQGVAIDYKRFQSDSMLANFIAEREAIREVIKEAVTTTNLMGFYPSLDYQKWAREMDIVSWDSYPEPDDPPAKVAMSHDLMRGIKGGRPFLLMEQTPSVANWSQNTALKRPGIMKLQSYQAIAHGADSVMFFQMRRSPAGCEKFHGALIDHAGSADTRVYKECAKLGGELQSLAGEIAGSRAENETALLFDWDTWWALECSVGPSARIDYLDEFYHYYHALHGLNAAADIIGMQDDLSKYKLVTAPMLYMVKENIEERLKEYVFQGGCLVLTYMSGYVNENDYITLGGYPGKLREISGVWIEESDALPEGKKNSFIYHGKQYRAEIMCDIIHLENAAAISQYQEEFYAGTPVITKNNYGKGKVYYVGTQSDPSFYHHFFQDICKESRVKIYEAAALSGIEIVKRKGPKGEYTFLLNHSSVSGEVLLMEDGTELISGQAVHKKQRIILAAKEVAIIKNA